VIRTSRRKNSVKKALRHSPNINRLRSRFRELVSPEVPPTEFLGRSLEEP
jgi:hypothetical protein